MYTPDCAPVTAVQATLSFCGRLRATAYSGAPLEAPAAAPAAPLGGGALPLLGTAPVGACSPRQAAPSAPVAAAARAARRSDRRLRLVSVRPCSDCSA